MAKDKSIRFTIKGPPQKGRKSFAIVKDVVDKSRKRKRIANECGKVKDERIEAINIAFNSGEKKLPECLLLLNEIKDELYKEEELKSPKAVWNNKNLELVESYFNKEYKRRKIRESSRKSMYHKLIKAVRTVGKISLYSATEDQIQDMVDSQYEGDRQRDIIMRLRQLLKFIGRHDCKLALDYPTDRVVKYLEQHEVDQLIDAIEDPIIKVLVAVGAKCGLRQSEIYGLRRHQVKGEENLLVDTQLLPDGTRRKPKGNKIRNTFMLEGGKGAVSECLKLPLKEMEKRRFGGKKIPDTVRKSCEKLWPDDETKHLNFHDTRHCYAVHLVTFGVPTETVAKFMGHTPEVCRKHYQGFMVSNSGIEMTKAILNKAKKS